MTYLDLIAVFFVCFTALVILGRWASTNERARTAEAAARVSIAEAQAEAVKIQVTGQLDVIREEAIREANRRERDA